MCQGIPVALQAQAGGMELGCEVAQQPRAIAAYRVFPSSSSLQALRMHTSRFCTRATRRLPARLAALDALTCRITPPSRVVSQGVVAGQPEPWVGWQTAHDLTRLTLWG